MPNMNLIDEYIRYLRLELNYSELTVKAYQTDLMGWADFATSGKPDSLVATDVTTSDLRQWIGHLSREGQSPRTIRRKVSALRTFFRFLMRRHGLRSNPASALSLMKMPHDLPVFIRPADTARILDGDGGAGSPMEENSDTNTDAFHQEFKRNRNRLIIDIFYSTGIRCSELINLLDVNVDTRKGELKVHGKRNKDRIIPFGSELCEAIDRYRRLRDSSPSTAISPSDRTAPLLVRDDGQPLYRKLVYNVVHNALEEAGVHASRLGPHVLRHSFATDMLNAGASISSVRQLLGHASLASTQLYTHVTYSELQHNYQLAHPRALKKGGKNGN